MSFADAFSDFSHVDDIHSENVILDGRQLVCQSRSQGDTWLYESCHDLSGWNVHTGGTATVQVVNLGEQGTGNPAGAWAFQFSTGATPTSLCSISRKLPTLPAAYGLWAIVALPAVDDNVQNALNIVVQDASNRAMSLLLYRDHVLVGASDGSYKLMASHSPSGPCEDWFENCPNEDGTNTITLYQGTQKNGCVTLTLPIGPPENAGLVFVSQQSGGASGQISQLQGINIGPTQLPDDATLQSVPWASPFNAQGVNVLFKVEDVCDETNIDDFAAGLIINGVTHEVALEKVFEAPNAGIIDYTKSVLFLWGTAEASISQGTEIAYKARMLNGKMMALLSVSFELVSVY